MPPVGPPREGTPSPRVVARISRPEGSVEVLVTPALEASLRDRGEQLDVGTFRVRRRDGSSYGVLGQDEYLAETGTALPGGACYDAARVLGAVARYDLTLDWDEPHHRLRFDSSLWARDLAWPILEQRVRRALAVGPPEDAVRALSPRWARLEALGPARPPPEARLRVSPSAARAGEGSSDDAQWRAADAWMTARAAAGAPVTAHAVQHLAALVEGTAPPRAYRDRASVQSGALEHEFLPAPAIPAAMEAFETWRTRNAPALPPILRAAELCTWLISIHPFADGNGRTARLALDWELARAGLALPTFDSPSSAHCARFARVPMEPPEQFLERLTAAMERTHGLSP